MTEQEIITAHNVRLRIGFASIGDRLLAALIDIFIKICIFLLMLALVGFFISIGRLEDSRQTWTYASTIFFVTTSFYFLLFEYFMDGQTPGKRALKIKVMSLNDKPLSFGQCLIRWMFRLVDLDFMPGIGIVMIVVTRQKQRLGDLAADTVVVNAKQQMTIEDTIYTNIENTRPVHYVNAGKLGPREVEIIKEVIRQYDEENKYDLLHMTAEKVRQAINADNDLHDIAFLKAVLEDHYMLAAQ